MTILDKLKSTPMHPIRSLEILGVVLFRFRMLPRSWAILLILVNAGSPWFLHASSVTSQLCMDISASYNGVSGRRRTTDGRASACQLSAFGHLAGDSKSREPDRKSLRE